MANTSVSRVNEVIHGKEMVIIRSVIACCDDVFLTVSRTLARATLTLPGRPKGNSQDNLRVLYELIHGLCDYLLS